MKKIVLLLAILIICIGFTNAQKEKISGNWLLTKVIEGDEPFEPFFIQNFKEDGKMVAMGHELGTWEYNAKKQLLLMHSDESKEFDGEFKIALLSPKSMQLEQGDIQLFYTKINQESVAENNALLNFEGEWKLDNDLDEMQLLKIEFPDTFFITRISPGGGSSTYNGNWMYNPEEKTVLFLGGSSFIRGFLAVKEISKKGFTLERNKTEIIGKKKQQQNQ